MLNASRANSTINSHKKTTKKSQNKKHFPETLILLFLFFILSMTTNHNGFSFVPDPVPLDDRGYCISFQSNEHDAIQKFFQRYGFVVIRDAISPAAVKATERDILQTAGFDHLPNYKELQGLQWDAISESSYNTKRGFLGFEPPWSEVAWENRFALYPAYSVLFNRSDLLVKLDRYGLMRPTRFLEADEASSSSTASSSASASSCSGEQKVGLVSRDDWQTESRWLHWDQNPWEEPDFVRVQGVKIDVRTFFYVALTLY